MAGGWVPEEDRGYVNGGRTAGGNEIYTNRGGTPEEQKYSKMEQRETIPIFVQIILVIIVLAVVLGGGYIGYQHFQKPAVSQPVISYPTNAVVVTQMQNIGKLETVSYTLQQVVVYDPGGVLGDPKKLFVFYGNVTAGVDLSTITSKDITRRMQGDKVISLTLNLPDSQILHSSIDPTRTKVYDASTGIVINSNPDPNTVNTIQAQAQQTQSSDACQDHILETAAANARTQLTSFLTTVGFPSVIVNVSAGKCS